MTTHIRQSEVSAVVWPWRESGPASCADDASARRRSAVAESAVGYCIGLLMLLVFKKRPIAMVVFSVASLVLIGGLFVPPLYRGMQKLGHWLARVVGTGITWVLLAPFFYVCFTTARLLLIVARKDPLHRKPDPGVSTYWDPHRSIAGSDRYTRQY